MIKDKMDAEGASQVTVKSRKIAVHPRTFKRKTKIENPSHREKLPEITPNFKRQRICQLMKAMDKNIEQFLICAKH